MTTDPGASGSGSGLPAVAAAAAALVSGIGLLTLTGALGRVQRNSGEAFVWAVALVVSGASLWVGGSLIRESARKVIVGPREIVRAVALVLILAGLGIAAWALRNTVVWPTGGVLILLIGGTVLWFLGARSKRDVRDFNIGLRELVQGVGLLVSLAGLVIGFRAAVLTADDTEQPAVTANLGLTDLSLTGTAKVGNLSSKDRLVVAVDGLVDSGGGYEPRGARALYEAYLGPDSDGTATHRLNVSIPSGQFDAIGVRAHTASEPRGCGEYPNTTSGNSEEETGCVIVRLPPRPDRPQLAASWDGRGRSASSLKLTLDAADLSIAPDGQLVLLRIVGVRARKPVTLYRALFSIPTGGKLKRDIRLPVEDAVRTVCAQAEIVAANASISSMPCPVGNSGDGSIVELRVPRSR